MIDFDNVEAYKDIYSEIIRIAKISISKGRRINSLRFPTQRSKKFTKSQRITYIVESGLAQALPVFYHYRLPGSLYFSLHPVPMYKKILLTVLLLR